MPRVLECIKEIKGVLGNMKDALRYQNVVRSMILCSVEIQY